MAAISGVMASHLAIVRTHTWGGKEGGKEGGREGGKEGVKEGGREGVKEGGSD